MENNFKTALDHVSKWEGGFSNDSNDPGGATKYGITKRTLRRYRRRKVTTEEVKNLLRSEAEAIYHELYWDTCRCGEIPSGLDIAVFDCSVNQGPKRAIKFLQRSLHVKTDGIIGYKTLMACNENETRRKKILIDFFTYRSLHYSSLSHFSFYGRGWLRRVFDTHNLCVEVIGREA